MVSHLKTPILNCFSYLLWAYFLTDSEFSCLAMLAKPYPMFGPTPMLLIPNQLQCIPISAHQVLGAAREARSQAVFSFKIICFVEGIVFRLNTTFVVICSPSVIPSISKLFSDSILILFMLYLVLWSCFSGTKTAAFHHSL